MTKDQMQIERLARNAGKLAYALHCREFESVGTEGRIVAKRQCQCPHCYMVSEAVYEQPWCDACLSKEGYLPKKYQTLASYLLFKPALLFLFRSGMSWDDAKKLVQYYEPHAEQIEKEGWPDNFLLKAMRWSVDKENICVMCGSVCGGNRTKNFCSSRCYMRDYRARGKK